MARKTCPHCKKTKDVDSGFGWRQMDGYQRPQSWCFDCRTSEPRPKQDIEIPANRQALMRLYRSVTGDTKIRSNHYMREALKKGKSA